MTTPVFVRFWKLKKEKNAQIIILYKVKMQVIIRHSCYIVIVFGLLSVEYLMWSY